MPGNRKIIVFLAAALAALPTFAPEASAQSARPPGEEPRARRSGRGMRPFAELAVGPLLGLDRPVRGAEAEAVGGIRWSPFELGARAAGAYDSALRTWDARVDLLLGLGSGVRAIVGGLILPGASQLVDSGGQEGTVRATPRDWPNRFGLGATLAEFLPRGEGPELGLDAELVYASYRVESESALLGAAAFAAGVEARIALRLRWGGRLPRP